MSSCTVLDPLGLKSFVDQGTFQNAVVKMFWMSLLATFLNFNCFLLCCEISILSCMHEYFCLVEGVSEETANIVFNKIACKVIKDPIKHTCLVLLTGAEAFVIINVKLLSYNNICCTTRRC
jgi:hypothetical protein